MTDTLPSAVLQDRTTSASRAALALVDAADTLILREGRASTRAWLESTRDQLCDIVVHLQAPNVEPSAIARSLPLFERWIDVARMTVAGIVTEHRRSPAS